jgi:hypothetical protein
MFETARDAFVVYVSATLNGHTTHPPDLSQLSLGFAATPIPGCCLLIIPRPDEDRSHTTQAQNRTAVRRFCRA